MKKIIIMICILTSLVYSAEIPKDIKKLLRSDERANTYVVNLKEVKNENVKEAFKRMIVIGKYMQENYPEANFLKIQIDDESQLGVLIDNKQLNLINKEISEETLKEARSKTEKYMAGWALEELYEN